MKTVDVVILCGGLGTRLREVTGEAPKVMVEVDGQPFLDRLIVFLKQQGFQRLILCTGYQATLIEEYYKNNSHGLSIIFSREAEPLGTGGAVKNAHALIQSNDFFVLNGDSFCPVNFQNFLNFYQNKKAVGVIAISEVNDSQEYGGLTLDDENRVLGFYEKSIGHKQKYVNAGVYCFNQKVFSLMPEDQKFSMEYDFFPRLVNQGLYGFLVEEVFLDIGTPERLEQARKGA